MTHNYMSALQDWFDSPPPEDAEMKEEADLLFHKLCSEIGRTEQKQLIRLVDVQDARQEKTALNSFVAGFKVAWGIFQELSCDQPYSFEREQEERARRMFMESLQREAQNGRKENQRDSGENTSSI